MMRRSDPLADPEPLIRRVYSYVAYRIGDGPEAEDVTSETFERALRGRDTYDPSRGTTTAWLLGIARRCISDAMANRETPVAEVPEFADTHDLEDDSIQRLTVGTAIATLEERDQELLALRYGADLTARRIAEVLGLQTNAVEVALHRALGRLREHLEGRGSTPSAEPGGSKVIAVER
jgi:RNA polymerase sigma factor (sigma-70 family)